MWEDSIRLNQAILASRCGDHEQALINLDVVRDPDLSLQVAGARMTALQGMGRLNEALSLAEACLSKEETVIKFRSATIMIAVLMVALGFLARASLYVVDERDPDARHHALLVI